MCFFISSRKSVKWEVMQNLMHNYLPFGTNEFQFSFKGYFKKIENHHFQTFALTFFTFYFSEKLFSISISYKLSDGVIFNFIP